MTIFSRFSFWRSLYNRYIDNVHPKESIVDRVCSLNDHNDSLRDHIRFLEKVSLFVSFFCLYFLYFIEKSFFFRSFLFNAFLSFFALDRDF